MSQISDDTLETINNLYEATSNQAAGKHLIKNDCHYIKQNTPPNLNSEHLQALKNLRQREDIIIKPADKGGAVVVMDINLYRQEALRQLSNTVYYRPLEVPLHTLTAVNIYQVLERMVQNGNIDRSQLAYLKSDLNDITPRYFYMLPKIHKPRSKWPHPDMPAGRPIVSDCHSESTRICELIDYYLQPLSKLHESYIKDTYHFISRVRDQVIEPHWLLISADVESLYTNMRIDLILQSIREMFDLYPDHTRPDSDILELLEITLRNNDFQFDGKFFLQICGIAMGRKYAPSAANIYLRKFDHQAMHNFRICPKLYGRFLDDIFGIWPGTKAELKEYETYLNSLIPGIKVTFTVRDQIIEFLDTQVYKHIDESGTCKLKTKVFFKPTDTHQLLHRNSFHPTHTFTGIVKSQFIRFKRISSTIFDYNEASYTLIKVLINRGYKPRELRNIKNQIWSKYDTTIKRHKQDDNVDVIPVITHFDRFHVRLNKTWCRHIRANNILNEARIISAFKRHKNLGDYLVKGLFGAPYSADDNQATDLYLDLLLMVMQSEGNK